MTAQLQDTVLTVRFGDGDLVALKTKYHHSFSPNFEQDIDHGIEVKLFSGLVMMVSMLSRSGLSLEGGVSSIRVRRYDTCALC